MFRLQGTQRLLNNAEMQPSSLKVEGWFVCMYLCDPESILISQSQKVKIIKSKFQAFNNLNLYFKKINKSASNLWTTTLLKRARILFLMMNYFKCLCPWIIYKIIIIHKNINDL